MDMKQRANYPPVSYRQQTQVTQEVSRMSQVSSDGIMWRAEEENKSLSELTPEERKEADRRLQDLEQRSKKPNSSGSLSTTETPHKVSLTALIDKHDWKHVMRRIRSHPRSMHHKHDIKLNGKQTRAYPLHHALSQRPPVRAIF